MMILVVWEWRQMAASGLGFGQATLLRRVKLEHDVGIGDYLEFLLGDGFDNTFSLVVSRRTARLDLEDESQPLHDWEVHVELLVPLSTLGAQDFGSVLQSLHGHGWQIQDVAWFDQRRDAYPDQTLRDWAETLPQ